MEQERSSPGESGENQTCYEDIHLIYQVQGFLTHGIAWGIFF